LPWSPVAIWPGANAVPPWCLVHPQLLGTRPGPLAIAGQAAHDALPGVAFCRPKVEDSRDETEHLGRLLACLAIEEVEVWMLALHRDLLPSPWAEIRGERDPKERFAHPFLAAHAPKLDPGQGRKWAMRDLGARWKGLLDVCPEIAELKTRIAGELGRRS